MTERDKLIAQAEALERHLSGGHGALISDRFARDVIETLRALAEQRPVGEPVATKCPTCRSPSPEKHPAVQAGGEVHLCKDMWHGPVPLCALPKELRPQASAPADRAAADAPNREAGGLVCLYAQEIGVPTHACTTCSYDIDEIEARRGGNSLRDRLYQCEKALQKLGFKDWDSLSAPSAVGVTPDLDVADDDFTLDHADDEVHSLRKFFGEDDATAKLFEDAIAIYKSRITDLRAQLAEIDKDLRHEIDMAGQAQLASAANANKAFERITRLEADNAKARELLGRCFLLSYMWPQDLLDGVKNFITRIRT